MGLDNELFILFFSSYIVSTISNPMDGSMPGFPVLHHLLKFAQFMSIESMMLSNCLILCCPLLLLPSIFPRIRVFFPISRLFTSGGQIIAASASASASVLPMNIQGCFFFFFFFFRIDWFDLLIVQGTWTRVFSSTTVWKHQFFNTQPSLWSNSHLYMTTGKTIALAI